MIRIQELIQKSNAILPSDGSKLYNVLVEELNTSSKIKISFEGLSHCTTAFLNSSLGKIWMNKPETANSFIIESASPMLLRKIEEVKENALNKEKRESREEILREFLEEA